MKLLTTAQVAERLGVHRTRLNVLIQEGRLAAQKFGRAYLLQEKDIKLVSERPAGRPPKMSKDLQAEKTSKRAKK